MNYIRNYQSLATTPQRKVALDLIEAALDSIQPQNVIHKNVQLQDKILKIQKESLDLASFEHIYLLGYGKGSAKISSLIEKILGDQLSEGYVIDVSPETFTKINFTLGTHPLPSQANIDFTQKVVDKLSNLSEKDLVIIITCGGGSVMLEKPHSLSLDQMTQINQALLHSQATIHEINTVRKHLDIVKGGGLAEILFPAQIVNLIASDVPGNDLSTIASGPTVKDTTTEEDALSVIEKHELGEKLNLKISDFIESPKDDKYFEKVKNILILSNDTALNAMKSKAQELGLTSKILTDSFQDDANLAAKKLIDLTPLRTVLLAGGETTLKVTGKGQGGRNQHLVLAALGSIAEGTIIASFDSDGWDNSEAAGAIADLNTQDKAQQLSLDPKKYLKDNNSLAFFKETGDAILTGRLPSNVSDLIIVAKI